MRRQYYSIEKLRQEIKKILEIKLDLKNYRIFIFGSRASGKASRYSDIDIGIEGPDPIPLVVLSGIKENIDNIPTLYKIDIVDFNKVPLTFKEVALQNIQPIL